MSEPVAVLAKIPALPGKRAELMEALRMGLETAQGESGTRYYIMHEDAVDPDAVWFYELYESQEALAEHGSSEAFKALGAAVRPFGAGRPELTFLKPVGGKGL